MTDQRAAGATIQFDSRKIKFQTPVLSRNLSGKSLDDLSKPTSDLEGFIADYCGYLAEVLYFDRELQDSLFAKLQKCREKIAEAIELKNSFALIVTLNDVIFEIHRVHVSIATEQELIQKRTKLDWQFPVFALIYIAIVIFIVFIGWKKELELVNVPMIGIPVSVLLWSFLGSLAAILYRFYSYNPIRNLNQARREFAWLIARPLTGIIMGLLSYVLIIAGLIVFNTGNTSESTNNSPEIKRQLLWAVAFISGFSDKFYLAFINTLVNKFSGTAPGSELRKNGK